MKHVLYRILPILLAALLCVPSFAAARAEETDSSLEIDTPYYIVVDASDPSVVFFERGADEKAIPGSTMKIMTCILALELCDDLDGTLVTATGAAANMKQTNSLMGVIKGEVLTMRQLIYGLMLESGNDAAMLIAQTLGGDVEGFVQIMNAKAVELGMVNTCFANASGAYRGTQFSTARDMAILTCYAMQNERFAEIVSTVHYTIPANNVRRRDLEMTNSNELISNPPDSATFYDLAIGVKTGSTEQGGKCLASAARYEGGTVVAILLGLKEGGSKNKRMNTVYLESKKLLDLALKQGYQSATPADLHLDVPTSVSVLGGEKASAAVSIEGEPTARLPLAVIERIQADPSLVTASADLRELTAPVSMGDPVGSVVYTYGGKTLFTAEFAAAEDVPLPVTPAPASAALITPVPASANDGVSQTSARTFPLLAALIALALLLCAVIVFFILHDRKKKRLAAKKRKRNRE